MAQRIVTVTTCDQCEPGTDTKVTATVRFGYAATEYDIDLCARHETEMQKVMGPLIQHARRIAGSLPGSGPRRNRKSESAIFKRDARNWGIDNGKAVSLRGRVPMSLLTEYREYLNNLQ